jgi:hypothetical protein
LFFVSVLEREHLPVATGRSQVVDLYRHDLANARETAGENQIYLRIIGLDMGKKLGFWAPNARQAARVSGCHCLKIPKKIPTGEWSVLWINGGAGGI